MLLPDLVVQIRLMGGEGSVEMSRRPPGIALGRVEIYSWMENYNCRQMGGRDMVSDWAEYLRKHLGMWEEKKGMTDVSCTLPCEI